jgi:hypothetical protein
VPPDVPIPVIAPDEGGEGESEEMATGNAFPQLMEAGNLQIAASALGQGAAGAAARRIDRADQISGDAQSSWTIAMQAPTNLTANALRTLNESGSGRTRVESNPPYINPPNVTIEKQT